MFAPTSSAEAALPRQGRHQALPPVCGFALALGPGPARDNPRFAQLGEHTHIEETSGGVPWAGTLIGPGTLARDGNTALALAGELYNRDDLGRAAGGTAGGTAGGVPDADLVLALWRRYDLAALRLLNGRYALVLADAGRVVAATDHAGGIPLHLSVQPDGTVHAATEAKTLYAQGLEPHQVAAGTAVVMHQGARRTLRTWVPPQGRRIMHADEAVADLRCRLSRAVRARCAGDRRPTVVLSGGIDSSAVTALTAAACGGARSVSLGTDAGDEFAAAALVARHVGTEHEELTVGSEQLVAELAWAVWAAEITDPDVLEYLLPLVALYRRLPGRRRILTGYGADIPLGGMHRDTVDLGTLDEVLATDMATYDGLNEMCPALSGIAGHWTTHPYWDRDVLDLLVGLEPGLKRRDGTDKWVLRTAFRDLLPDSVVRRRKLGIHEGSGTTSTWTRLLLQDGVPPQGIADAKLAQARRLHQRLVAGGEHPADLAGGLR